MGGIPDDVVVEIAAEVSRSNQSMEGGIREKTLEEILVKISGETSVLHSGKDLGKNTRRNACENSVKHLGNNCKRNPKKILRKNALKKSEIKFRKNSCQNSWANSISDIVISKEKIQK